MSDTVNGTAYCEHVHQDERNVTVCSPWCRHFPGGPRNGVVCPYAEGQCVADHGPAPFLPSEPTAAGNTHMQVEFPDPPDTRDLVPDVEAAARALSAERRGVLDRLAPHDTDTLGEFGRAADHGFANIVRPTYAQRGAQYGDTWALDDLYTEQDRLQDAQALVRVKCRRVIATGGQHRDSVLDLIAYASAYLTWGDAADVWEG